ncbi:MAG: lipoate--protein ligase [Desulfobacteraceae bacterium]|jgi:lipoate-protein ligase A|nr:lipoate--protein ligase [Desulfobacteraceae bacterium]
MFLIRHNDVSDPAINLALEEYCLNTLDPGSEYLLFYTNRPSIIIGRHQNPFQEFNQDQARQKGIVALRRISGGGAVYHDLGNLNFSFITDFTGEKLDYFKTLIEPILNTLRHLGVPAQLTGKNNIQVDGKKVSGTSQHTNMRRMLSHGTLLFDSELGVLQRVLDSNLTITKSRAVSSIKSKVTNISRHLRRPMGMDDFRAEMVDGISRVFGELIEYRLAAADWEAVDLLAQKKYNSWDWTYGRSPEFVVQHKISLDTGDVKAHLVVNKGVIKAIALADRLAESSSPNKTINELIGERFDF